MGYKSRGWMNSEWLPGAIALFIGACIGCLVFSALVWILWWAWGMFVPAVWPNGPYQVVYIGYWQFFAGWVILVTLIKVLRGYK